MTQKQNPPHGGCFQFLLVTAILWLAFIYGVVSQRYELWPHDTIEDMEAVFLLQLAKWRGDLPLYYRAVDRARDTDGPKRGNAFPGLNLVVSVVSDDRLSARIIDMDGALMHEWIIDWFDIWPDADHIPTDELPREAPGTHIHGAVVTDDGNLVFNFEHLGLVRIDRCGAVVWRLPYRTHHSVEPGSGGNFWVSGQRDRTEPVPGLSNHRPPFIEPMVLEVSADGEILQEISIMELLLENDLAGLLYMSTLQNQDTGVTGDTLHLNDVELFPASMDPGHFRPGDLMVSLRNINTVLVFDPATSQIKFLHTGGFVRQHDPDFLDGNTISVFDNNNVAAESESSASRIVILSAESGESRVYFEGSSTRPFYTDIMGKHQWLPNGNVLVVESVRGRAFEIDSDGEIVWEFVNYIDDESLGVEDGEVVGLVEEVQRLPMALAAQFSAEKLAACAR